jgi:hypothetical protein
MLVRFKIELSLKHLLENVIEFVETFIRECNRIR